MGKKNYGKSVKTRLLNLMNETGYKYMYLLARYFNERLLYRVMQVITDRLKPMAEKYWNK